MEVIIPIVALLEWGIEKKKKIAEDGFDPSTSGLWAQHAPTAPLCYVVRCCCHSLMNHRKMMPFVNTQTPTSVGESSKKVFLRGEPYLTNLLPNHWQTCPQRSGMPIIFTVKWVVLTSLRYIHGVIYNHNVTISLNIGILINHISRLLPRRGAWSSLIPFPGLCFSVCFQYNTHKHKSSENRDLPLPCIILNVNRRTKMGERGYLISRLT